MVVTGSISNVQGPSKAVPGTNVKVTFGVTINNTTWGAPSYNYQFLIDNDLKNDSTKKYGALKGNLIFGTGGYTRNEDITITMPDKNLSYVLELWFGGTLTPTVPTKYTGVPIEELL